MHSQEPSTLEGNLQVSKDCASHPVCPSPSLHTSLQDKSSPEPAGRERGRARVKRCGGALPPSIHCAAREPSAGARGLVPASLITLIMEAARRLQHILWHGNCRERTLSAVAFLTQGNNVWSRRKRQKPTRSGCTQNILAGIWLLTPCERKMFQRGPDTSTVWCWWLKIRKK